MSRVTLRDMMSAKARLVAVQGLRLGGPGVGSDGDTYTREGRLARVLRRELLAWRLAAGGLARGLLNKEIVRNEYARGEREALRVCA